MTQDRKVVEIKTRVQKAYQAISPEPYLQFSQTGPNFIKNHRMNPIKLWNVKNVFDFWVCGLETTYGTQET